MTSLGPKIRLIGDGSSLGNPGPSGWGLIIADTTQVIELGDRAERATNNQMELQAYLEALNFLIGAETEGAQISAFWDSKFVLSGVKAWRFGWRRKSWKTASGEPVKNLELWQEIDEKMEALSSNSFEFYHVPGHQGIPANERADEICRSFAEGKEPVLYQGDLLSYGIDIAESLPTEAFQLKASSPSAKSKKPLFYLSYVGGKVHRDPSWGACEARVKGVANAKYKKIFSEAEEAQVLKSWGV